MGQLALSRALVSLLVVGLALPLEVKNISLRFVFSCVRPLGELSSDCGFLMLFYSVHSPASVVVSVSIVGI